MITAFNKNRNLFIIMACLAVMFLLAISSMSTKDWVITLLRSLSLAAIVFLVASGFSLIFGLLEVLNLAHGTLFMIGAFAGWTFYLRPDTVVDVVTPLALLTAGIMLRPLLTKMMVGLPSIFNSKNLALHKVVLWSVLIIALVVVAFSWKQYPISIWDPDVYDRAPVVYAGEFDNGNLIIPPNVGFGDKSPLFVMLGILLGGALLAVSLAGFAARRATTQATGKLWKALVGPGLVILAGLVIYLFNDSLTAWLFSISSNWRFLLAVVFATCVGFALGGLMETKLIRPLYVRPIYQIMLTLGLAVVGSEIVMKLWGRTQLVMTKPAMFNGGGSGCPAQGFSDWYANSCATISFMGARLRTYNEIFVIVVGLVVLVAVGLLLHRTRIGMIIRAGVQDREMVEALGINVLRVFTFVFALGVGLAALGGVIAGPSMGVSESMGSDMLLMALIAMAIGGLTSFSGAAVGSLLVGLLTQFIIKFGQIGIPLPFLAEPFKPSPPLVPASTVLLMVIVLLIMPNGLLGRKE